MDAICLHLCDQITQPQKEAGLCGQVVYTSKWRQVLSADNNVRARLLNSEALLEGTNPRVGVRWHPQSLGRCGEEGHFQGGAGQAMPLQDPEHRQDGEPSRGVAALSPLPQTHWVSHFSWRCGIFGRSRSGMLCVSRIPPASNFPPSLATSLRAV